MAKDGAYGWSLNDDFNGFELMQSLTMRCRCDCGQPHQRVADQSRSVLLGRLDVLRGAGTGLSCATVLSLNRVVNFLAVYRDRLGRFNAEADFVPSDVYKLYEGWDYEKWQEYKDESFVISSLKVNNVKKYLSPAPAIVQ